MMRAPRRPGDELRRQALHVEVQGSNLIGDDTPVSTTPGSGHQVQPDTWRSYWDCCLSIKGSRGWSTNVYTAGSSGPVVLCVHGCGYTGLTWSLVANCLKDKYRVVAPDLRGHGVTVSDDDLDLSAETLSQDLVDLCDLMFSNEKDLSILIVGHSMGAAISVRAATGARIKGLAGLVVVDVVEGTALAALPHMMGVINSRPQSFTSLQEAIHWATRTGMSKNRQSAAVSVPSQLVKAGAESGYRWRVPLAQTRQHWEGWYRGLSSMFLGIPVPKMLILAGTDRLDRELTIGQMQGKFQLVLLPTAGHAIQEDEPSQLSTHLLNFLHRFRIGEPPMQFPKAPGCRPVLPIVAGPTMTPN